MFWVIYHRNGVALTEAADRVSALNCCETQLGHALRPFAIIPAIEADLEDFGMSIGIGQKDLDIARRICEATERIAPALSNLADHGTLHSGDFGFTTIYAALKHDDDTLGCGTSAGQRITFNVFYRGTA